MSNETKKPEWVWLTWLSTSARDHLHLSVGVPYKVVSWSDLPGEQPRIHVEPRCGLVWGDGYLLGRGTVWVPCAPPVTQPESEMFGMASALYRGMADGRGIVDVGVGLKVNPYTVNTDAWDAWQAGFNSVIQAERAVKAEAELSAEKRASEGYIKQRNEALADLSMHVTAWGRELVSWPKKSHQIDGLVLGTRRLRERAEAAEAEAAMLRSEVAMLKAGARPPDAKPALDVLRDAYFETEARGAADIGYVAGSRQDAAKAWIVALDDSRAKEV